MMFYVPRTAPRRLLSLLLSALLLFSLFGCGKKAPPPEPPPAQEGTEAIPPPDTPKYVYDYTKPVPANAAVDETYFSDAVFIGNSRTEGFALYSGLPNIQSLAHIGLMVDTVFTEAVIDVDGKKLTVMDALAQKKFSKVYIMLGMNELGWSYSSLFRDGYAKIIDRIREINPDAKIYIQSMLPVSAKKSTESSIYNNNKVVEYNDLLRALATEKKVYFVNVAEAVMDESGALPADAATDGLHLVPEYCKLWLSYLKTHTAREES